jgi:hypothetical protein
MYNAGVVVVNSEVWIGFRKKWFLVEYLMQLILENTI